MRKGKTLFVRILCVLLMLFSLSGCYQKSENSKQAGSTPDEAVLQFLSEEQDVNISSKQLDDTILDHFMEDDIQYYLLKGMQETGANPACYVYVVKVVQKKSGIYTCEKFTADYFLESPEGANDIEYTPYLQYVIPVDRFYFHVGMVFDSSYKPYFQDRKLNVDENGIFVQITKESGANVKMKKK